MEALFPCAGVSLSEQVRDICGMVGPGGPVICQSKAEYWVYHKVDTGDSHTSGKMCWFFIRVL